jgi:CRP-like cAMP-binding protein
MDLPLSAATLVGLAGAAFAVASFLMKRMLPLRLLALAGNACFAAYGLLGSDLPTLVLNAALIPIQVFRVREIRTVAREMARSSAESPVSQWLLPHMRRMAFKSGEILFHKGDPAGELVYVASGRMRLEDGHVLGAGELIGEIGLFSPERRRTMTVVCETDGELYRISDEQIYLLYFQNPALGFYFMRLVAQRLCRDLGERHDKAAEQIRV